MKIGPKRSERHQFLEIQDGGSRHVEFRLPGIFRYHMCVVIHSRNIPTKFGEIGEELKERYQFFEIQDGCGRHFEDYTSG